MSGNLKIVIVDNQDSFTHNIFQYCLIAGVQTTVISADDYRTHLELLGGSSGIILSPGPGAPHEAHGSIEVLKQFAKKLPILGVCLGHQIIGEFFGGQVKTANRIMHGKTTLVETKGKGLFCDLPIKFNVARYHSLILMRDSLPNELEVSCESNEIIHGHKEIMGIQHTSYPIHGVQFHPEAILTEFGQKIICNFVQICADFHSSKKGN